MLEKEKYLEQMSDDDNFFYKNGNFYQKYVIVT